MLTSNGAATRQTPAVGVSDFARELQIKHYGNLVVRAMAAGDRHTANNWLQAQMLAIAQRSPAQQARMTADIEQAISDGNDYFAVQGAMRAAA